MACSVVAACLAQYMRAADASDAIAASVCLELGFEAVQDLSVLEDDNRRKEVAVLLAGRAIAHLGKGDIDSLVDELENDLLVIAQRARAAEPPDFRQHPWFLRQPLYVQVFVKDVRPGKDSHHPVDVVCMCGALHRADHFERRHLRSIQHEADLWKAVRDSEAELIARAERTEWWYSTVYVCSSAVKRYEGRGPRKSCMGPEFDGPWPGPDRRPKFDVGYLTEGPSCTQNLTYYPPLGGGGGGAEYTEYFIS